MTRKPDPFSRAATSFFWKAVDPEVPLPRSNTRPSVVLVWIFREGVVGPEFWGAFSVACLLVGGSFSCWHTFACARGRLEPLVVSGLCGELVAFGMLCRGARRAAVAILAKGSCGDGGINTAAAIHKDILLRMEEMVAEGAVEGGVDAKGTRASTTECANS